MRILPDRISPFRTPGVHIDIVARDKKPFFMTGVPVFVGFGKLTAWAARHRDNPWCWIASWRQFEQSVEMTAHRESFLRYAVRGFFENGGECCVVLPVSESCLSADALGEPFQDTDDTSLGKPGRMRGIMEDIEDIDLICIPDLMMECIRQSEAAVIEVQQLVLKHCRKMGDRFAILDAFPATGRTSVAQVISDRNKIQGSEGALYFPWLLVSELSMSTPDLGFMPSDQLNSGVEVLTIRADERKLCLTPPCGHVAGVYARTDARFGVFKAPANEILEGAFDLGALLTRDQQAELNHSGINCIRSSLSRGVRVWGARTLSVHSHDQYITTRRLFSTLVRWLEKNMNDLVFENHDDLLWRRIRHRIEGYCYELFQKGALKGLAPEEAYFVKCDRELNGAEARELGQVVSEVGLASVVPAEFIIVRITQSASGATASFSS